MKHRLQIINNFCHDLFSGFWLATLLLLYLLSRVQIPSTALKQWVEVVQQFFWFGPGSLAIIIGTGFLRFFYYSRGVDQNRDKLLIVKHIILVVFYGVGTYFQYVFAFKAL